MKLLDSLPCDSPAAGFGLLDRLGATSKIVPDALRLPDSDRFGRPPVGNSPDLERILTLPVRERPGEAALAQMVATMTALLRLPDGPCNCAALRPEIVARGENPCIKTFRPIQAWYLTEAARGGVLGPITVGGGKTALDIFTAMVVPGCRVAVLLIPPGLRAQFAADYEVWAQHFKVPNLAGGRGTFHPGRPALEVLAYTELSHERCASWLTIRAPDIIIADEAQNLKRRESVRTGRFLRYFLAKSETKFFCHSGSLSTRALEDYAHLSALALREGSPVPLDPHTVHEWGTAINPVNEGGLGAPPGALRALCIPGDTVWRGFHRRLVKTQGVVSTADNALPVALELSTRDPGPIPVKIRLALAEVRESARRPDGEELITILDVMKVCRQLAAGFFYRWRFPRMEPEKLILEWFGKRQAWNRELRECLKHPREGMDSPKLAKDAAIRAEAGYTGSLPTWRAANWREWAEIESAVYHETETVWIDDYLARDAVAWAAERPGIVWYLHGAFGRKVAELGAAAGTNLPVLPLGTFFGAGQEAELTIRQEHGSRSIVASIKAHGTGRNLQAFNRNLVSNVFADGGGWEQLIGRTHREGQPASKVTVDMYRHTSELQDAVKKATAYAAYTQETMGTPQKLLYGTWTDT